MHLSANGPAISGLIWRLMQGVREIDHACVRKLHDVEAGLCNVKRQFQADLDEGLGSPPGRKVKEEDAITWLLDLQLRRMGLTTKPWRYYPSSRKTCDLVVHVADHEFWLEVKLAWRKWYNCTGTYGTSPAYLPYLLGSKHKTHSVADDFIKLERLAPAAATKGLLLIGFDAVDAAMDTDVHAISEAVSTGGWVNDHMMWHDRRNPRCRIHTWLWHLPAQAVN